eukprot:COSAG01_NODE_1_length_100484_cov_170.446142_44_plen_324_part_00
MAGYWDKKRVNAKFPRYKKYTDKQSFRLNYESQDKLKAHVLHEADRDYFLLKIKKKGKLKIPYIKHREARPFSSGVATVSRAANSYAISFNTVEEKPVVIKAKGEQRQVGIDRNTKNVLALDDQYRGRANIFELSKNKKGEVMTDKLTRRLQTLQKDLARKYQPNKKQHEQSNNYKKNKLAIQKIHLKIANVRKDRSHFISAQVARKYDHVVIEDLKLKNMTRSAKGTVDEPGKQVKVKSGLNRVILNANLGQVSEFLAYKLSYSGKTLEKVNPKNTSITCGECGYVDKKNRVKQALFKCMKCGYTTHADINAAGNIKRKSSS